MKKLWLLVVLMVALVAMTANAQSPMKFGIKAGGSLANLSGDDVDNVKAKFGFAGGLFMQVHFGQGGPLALQPEVLYVMKGAKDDEEGSDGKYKLDYIEVPVLVKYYIPVQGQFMPNLFAGPAVGINMSAKYSSDDEDVDIDNIKAIDFGVAFGGGFDYALASGSKICFDVRYTLGLSTITDDPTEGEINWTSATDETKGADVKTGTFMFTLGFMF